MPGIAARRHIARPFALGREVQEGGHINASSPTSVNVIWRTTIQPDSGCHALQYRRTICRIAFCHLAFANENSMQNAPAMVIVNGISNSFQHFYKFNISLYLCTKTEKCTTMLLLLNQCNYLTHSIHRHDIVHSE